MEPSEEIIHDIPDPTPHLPGVAIPLWVWILLAFALLGVALLILAIVLLRNKDAAPKSIEDVYKICCKNLKALRDEAADLALEMAAKKLSDTVSESDRERLMDEFITRVEPNGAAEGAN